MAKIRMDEKPIIVACHICGKVEERLIHPDELKIGRPPAHGLILCNYCHRPVCFDHISTVQIERLVKIRPQQQFCLSCAEALSKSTTES